MISVDWELLLPIGFALLASFGLVFGIIAAYYYVLRERSNDSPHLPVAITAFVVQYGLVFCFTVLRDYKLLPTIMIFLTGVALVAAISLGLQAHSNAGYRIALAGLFTLGAYICRIAGDSKQFLNLYR
jgi:hypothetical protein